MKLLRRLLIILLGLGVLLGAGGAVAYFVVFAPVSTVGAVEFERKLKIPPLAESRVAPDGTRVFELTARQDTTELLPGKPTRTWGFNGSYLGPTLRAERGERVRVEIGNELEESTTVHWHGMHLPAAADGGPHQMVEPGGAWTPSWRIDQPAATLWYHPHPHGSTEEHVSRGLAGLFLLDEPTSAVADRLPHTYGTDDIPVIVQDPRFDGDGQIRPGGLGEDLLVNGTYGPYLDVTTEQVRLRLLNASVKRAYDFGFSDDRRFTLIGTDGGLLPAPVSMNRLALSPGERAEIIVSFSPGDTTVLRSYAPDLGSSSMEERFNGGQDEFDVLQLRAPPRLEPSTPVPAKLAPAPELDLDGATTRTFDLRGREINGKTMDMSRVDETVELGATEIWTVTNTGGQYHNFHVHDVQFDILTVDGREPGAHLSGWKDTVFLPPGRSVRIAMRFTDYADPDVPYMYHCHLLQHEDEGMMGQFVVVEPGQTAGAPAHHEHD